MNINREELAWAAGFFDGEGNCGPSRRSDGGLIVPDLNITQADRFVLDRFKAAVGVGRVYGPYGYAGRAAHHKPRWIFRTRGFHQTQAIIGMLWRWLSPTKRAQMVVALTGSVTSARSRPGKLHTRKVCKYGHSLTAESNIRREIRSGYPIRRCRACERRRGRDAMRHLSLVKKTAAALLVAS